MNSDVENSFDDLNSELLEILPPDYPDGGGDEVGTDEEDGELPGPDGLLHQEGGDPSHGKEEEQSNEPCGHTEHTVSNEIHALSPMSHLMWSLALQQAGPCWAGKKLLI